MRRGPTVLGLIAAVFAVFALLAPRIFLNNILIVELLITASVFAMFAASWDILSGYTGQENFGHAAFIGAGGFTVGLLTKFADLPLELSLIVGALMAALLGLLIGIPALRLRGPYLALATLATATALLRLAIIFKRYTGGEEGISRIPNLGEGSILGPVGRFLGRTVLGSGTFEDLRRIDEISVVNYYIAVGVMIVVVSVLTAVGRSKRGLVLRSIQQDELAAEAAGIGTARYKIAAFALSSGMAGLAGAVWVHTLSQVNINTLAVDLSLLIIVMAILGGAGSIIGPAAGAYLIVILQDYVLDRVGIEPGSQIKPMLFSALLILVMILRPAGLVAPLLRRLQGKRVLPERARG